MGECWHKILTQHAPATKMECDYLYTKISPKMVNPRDIGGEREEEEEEEEEEEKTEKEEEEARE